MPPAHIPQNDEASQIFDSNYVLPKIWWAGKRRTYDLALTAGLALGLLIVGVVFGFNFFSIFLVGVFGIFAAASGQIWYYFCPRIDSRCNKPGGLQFRHRLFLWSLAVFIMLELVVPCFMVIL